MVESCGVFYVVHFKIYSIFYVLYISIYSFLISCLFMFSLGNSFVLAVWRCSFEPSGLVRTLVTVSVDLASVQPTVVLAAILKEAEQKPAQQCAPLPLANNKKSDKRKTQYTNAFLYLYIYIDRYLRSLACPNMFSPLIYGASLRESISSARINQIRSTQFEDLRDARDFPHRSRRSPFTSGNNLFTFYLFLFTICWFENGDHPNSPRKTSSFGACQSIQVICGRALSITTANSFGESQTSRLRMWCTLSRKEYNHLLA